MRRAERHLLSPLQEKSRLSSSHKQLVTWWKLFLWWACDGQHWESCCCSTRYRCDLFSDVVLFLESLLFKLKRNKQETWYLLDDHISLYYSAINPVNIMHYLLLIISKYKYFLFSRCRRFATTLHRTKNGWDSVRFPNAASLPSSVTFSCKRRVLRTSYWALSWTTAQLYCA